MRKFVTAVLIGYFIILVYWTNRIFNLTDPEIKPGQVWIQTFGSDDPFKEKTYDTLKILDVKGEYVQYDRISHGIHQIESDRKHWIYDLSKLQK